jgi:CTP synthase
VPLSYHREGLDREVLRHFNLSIYGEPDMRRAAGGRAHHQPKAT